MKTDVMTLYSGLVVSLNVSLSTLIVTSVRHIII